jgi:hypothetical protein
MPIRSEVHVDAPLTNVSIAHFQDATNFAAASIPGVPVSKISDKFFVYSKADLLRDEMQERASGSESVETNYSLSTSSYYCDRFSLKIPVTDDEIAEADSPLQPLADAAEVLTQKALIKHEVKMAAVVMAAGSWGANTAALSGTSRFDDYTGSDPIDAIGDACRTVQPAGKMANTIVTNYKVFSVLRDHPDVIARLRDGGTDPKTANANDLARIFGVEKFLVSGGVYNSAIGGATASYGSIVANSLLVCYLDPTASLKKPSAFKRFDLRRFGLSQIKRWREEKREAEMVEINCAFDYVITGAELGYLYTTVVS